MDTTLVPTTLTLGPPEGVPEGPFLSATSFAPFREAFPGPEDKALTPTPRGFAGNSCTPVGPDATPMRADGAVAHPNVDFILSEEVYATTRVEPPVGGTFVWSVFLFLFFFWRALDAFFASSCCGETFRRYSVVVTYTVPNALTPSLGLAISVGTPINAGDVLLRSPFSVFNEVWRTDISTTRPRPLPPTYMSYIS